MGLWHTQGGQVYEGIGHDATNYGTIVLSGNANQPGSWTVLSSATLRECCLIILQVALISSCDALVSLAVGESTFEQVIVENLPVSGQLVAKTQYYYLPLSIPKGSRVTTQLRATITNADARVAASLVAGGFGAEPPHRHMTSYGVNLTDTGGVLVDCGATANTESAWQQITASTVRRHRALLFAMSPNNNGALTDGTFLIDIGVGPSGNVQPLMENLLIQEVAAGDFHGVQCTPPLPCNVPAGSSLWVRAMSTITALSDRAFDATLYGLS